MVKRILLPIAAIVVLVGAAVAAVLVASGDGMPSNAAPTVSIGTIQLAASNTEAAESMQFELNSTGDLGVTASGVVSGDGQQGQVSVTLGKLGDIEERIVDGTVYVKTGALFGGSGGQWMSISLDRLGDLGSAFGDTAATPRGALDLLDQAAGPVETVGDDTIAGRHATHYRVNVDAVDADDADAAVDVWIDDQDRVVKLRGSAPQMGEITFEVTAFGVPVDVQAPPPDQVVELPGLSGMLAAI